MFGFSTMKSMLKVNIHLFHCLKPNIYIALPKGIYVKNCDINICFVVVLFIPSLLFLSLYILLKYLMSGQKCFSFLFLLTFSSFMYCIALPLLIAFLTLHNSQLFVLFWDIYLFTYIFIYVCREHTRLYITVRTTK